MNLLARKKNVSIQLLLAAMCFLFVVAEAYAQNPNPTQKETPMTQHATGPFDVKVTHQDDNSSDPLLARMTLEKQYHGDLDATGQGQMLTAGTAVKGSGAYVAIEKVSGTLKGRTGTFVLQHTGTMTQNVPQLTIVVVPDYGTGQLAGLTGKMTITIAPGGKHSYDFEYTLPAAP